MLKQRPAARLITIVGLLLIPIAVLSYLFFQTTNSAIHSTAKERQGVALLKAVLPIVTKLSTNGSEVTSDEIAHLHKARNEFATPLQVVPLLDKLLSELVDGKKALAETDAHHHEGKHSHSAAEGGLIEANEHRHQAALLIGRQLIVQIGDNSNLILDPELDSYYLMEAVVLRIPELIKLSADLGGHSESHDHEIAKLDDAKHQQLAVGEFTASLTAFRTAIGKAVESNVNGGVERNLAEVADVYAKKAEVHSFSFLTMDEATEAKLATMGQLLVLQQGFAEASLAMWQTAARNLDLLLEKRIATLRQQQFIAGGITAVVTLLAIGLAVALVSRIVGKLDEHIVYLAHYDAMTKLKNRAAFTTDLEIEVKALTNSKTSSALHLIDVDHFKAINDSMGHQLGDAVLTGIATRLNSVCSTNDILGRLGGDEFVILQRGITDNWQATAMADRLVAAMREPLEIDHKPFKASVSIGTALAPIHGDSVEKFLHSADLALYAAKGAGRDRACFYSDDLNRDVLERQRLENEVRTALVENRFFLNFQAQFNATGKALRGFEALLRLRTSTGETVSPLQFIPLVEQMGLIDEVGAWVLEKAALTATQWPEQVTLAVNISPLQLKSGKLCDAVQNALQVSKLTPARLEIEVTENILLDDSKSILQQLQEIKAMGVSIALDDFGSGYSSLSYLWRFPFNKLKIDRSFMRAYEADRHQAENILRTIVMLGHSLHMTVAAEGVETNAQADFLNGVNCDEIQGFLYSRPVGEKDLAAVMIRAFEDEIEVRKLISIMAPDNPNAGKALFKSL